MVLLILTVNADGLQPLNHDDTGTPQFRSLIRESGQVRITETEKITVHLNPLILPVLLWCFMIDDESMNTPPMGKHLCTGLSGGIEESLDCGKNLRT